MSKHTKEYLYGLLSRTKKFFPEVYDIYNVIWQNAISENGIFDFDPPTDLLNICGCGDPDAICLLFYQIMERLANKEYISEPSDRNRQLLISLVLYDLDKIGWTDHSTSIFGSRLTDKGMVALELMSIYYGKRFLQRCGA